MCTLRPRAGDENPLWKIYPLFGLTLFFAGCLLVFLSGCEDPSNVGVGLAPEEGTSPTRVTIRANDVQQTSFASPTGNRSTIVFGSVSDPLFGRVSALGYMDLAAPGSVPDNFSDDENEISSVVFKLHRSYLYGDTTGTTELVLHSMDANWPAAGTSSDTSLTAGTEITRALIHPGDTLVEVPMPDSWIEAHENDLRGENPSFTSDFHGFQFSAPDAHLIEGFRADSSYLEVTIGDESAQFSISKELSTLERSEDPSPGENRVALQTGVGPAVSMQLPLTSDSLSNMVMNRVRLTLPIDIQTMEQNVPTNFTRPIPGQLIIYGVDEEGDRTPLYPGQLDKENEQYVFDHPQLTNQFQNVILGEADYERYVVAGSTSDAITVSPALLYGSSSETQGPSAALTIVPLD